MDEPTALLARAQTLLDVHRYDDAIALLATGVAQEPENYGLQKTLARALLLAGRSKEAAQVAERAALLSPTDAEPHCIRAEAFVDLGYFHQGDEASIKACELGPNDARAHFVRVRSALGLDLTNAAWAAANRVLELVPYSSLGHHARGLVFIKRKAWREAEVEYRAALAIAPNDASLLNNCGLALHNLGRDKEAIEFFTRAGEIDARRDTFRKNTAIAARRHIGGVRRIFAKVDLVKDAGPWILFALTLILIWTASNSPRAFVIVVGALALVVVLLLLRRRLRLARLPTAARVALEIDSKEREARRSSQPRRRLVAGGAVLAAFLIAFLLATTGIGDNSNDPGAPFEDGTLRPDLCEIVSTEPGPVALQLCPDSTSSSTTVEPFGP